MYKLRSLYLLTTMLIGVFASGQNLNGLWKGAIVAGDSLLQYELLITGEEGKFIKGYGQTTFMIGGVANVGVKEVKIKRKSNAFHLEDFDLVFDNYTMDPKKVKLYADLGLYYDGPFAILKGSFYTRVMELNTLTRPFTKGSLELRKVDPEQAGTLPQRINELKNAPKEHTASKAELAKTKKDTKKDSGKPQPLVAGTSGAAAVDGSGSTIAKETVSSTAPKQAAQPAAKVTRKQREEEAKATALAEKDKKNQTIIATPQKLPNPRTTVVIRDILVDSDSLAFSLYDNGEIDGDTVSIYLNGELFVPRIGLTAQATTYSLRFDSIPGDTLQLVLYAENLGTIPPNTGILILQDGNKRYDIGFTGDLSVCPAITLRRRRVSNN